MPNAITLLRLVGSIIVSLIAVQEHSLWLFVAAMIVHWVGDIADGYSARLLDQETRFGAVFDILSDRMCAIPVAIGVAWLYPTLMLPIVLWLVGFGCVDTVLSLCFLGWPLRGVGGFAWVHRGLYRMNFSPPAKALNSSVFFIALAVFPSPWPASVIAAGTLIGKSISAVVAIRALLRRPAARRIRCLSELPADIHAFDIPAEAA